MAINSGLGVKSIEFLGWTNIGIENRRTDFDAGFTTLWVVDLNNPLVKF